MSSSKKDYNKLYLIQDKFLTWWKTLDLPFYLTGGTALGRFYLNHRYSEDLDFFTNANPDYFNYITKLKTDIAKFFKLDVEQSLFTEDFSRIFINDNNTLLKIEFVNDIPYHSSKPIKYNFGLLDTAENILANKLTTIVGRDEPKDIFDVIYISLNYSFNWKDLFKHAKEKTVINEIDIEERLYTFPVEWLENVNWLSEKPDKEFLKKTLQIIADDFFLGSDNSLGKDKPPIGKATINQ